MADAIPQDLAILQALQTHLAFINPENESPGAGDAYRFDLRDKVWISRNQFGINEVPAVAILESPRPLTGIGAGEDKLKRNEEWNLLVQGFADDDKTSPGSTAYWLKAYVVERLARLVAINDQGRPAFPEEYFLGKLITGLTIGQGVVRPPEANVSPTAFFYLPLLVKRVTDSSNPFAV